MSEVRVEKGKTYILDKDGIGLLIGDLVGMEYQVIGPVLRDNAVIYDKIDGIADLPQSYKDEQSPGKYRLHKTTDSLFRYVVGPHSWKRYLHPAEIDLWSAVKTASGYKLQSDNGSIPRFAFFGVRPCDLKAIQIQDKVLIESDFADPIYKSRRERAFLIAVNCTHPGNNCFCDSMGTGPRAKSGFDLALTEVNDGVHYFFAVEVGSEAGEKVLGKLQTRIADENELEIVDKLLTDAANKMGKEIDCDDLKAMLERNLDHPHWDEIAARCLACGNCTMVCPTCFCTTVQDATDLSGSAAQRIRRWDSCFTADFSYIFGGCVRSSGMSRYRQWMTHKLATWVDQFGSYGCVGCGRCITWCPVGIDITEEVRAFRDFELKLKGV